MTDIIQGYGGGGKGGGGSARVAEEAPDSLQSVQYARVIDLVSEGEIGGLVNGSKSIYINDTPLLNDNGQYNFTGVAIDSRVGTQSQTYMPGFPSVENEVQVGTEVKYGLPVTRSITNSNINAARLTVSFPSLTSQDTKNGDINGTTVQLQVHYQNNSGGFIPARISIENINLSSSGLSATSGSTKILQASVDITWTGEDPGYLPIYDVFSQYPIQYCYWAFQYRALPFGIWTTYQTGVLSAAPLRRVYLNENNQLVASVTVPTGNQSIQFQGLPESAYEFRVIKTSGTGSLAAIYGQAATYTPNIYISGKTRSRYQRSIKLQLPAPGPWDIRVTRITPDSTTAALQNASYFESYTEIIDTKLSYPNSALFGLSIDARQFNSIPTRAYDIYGIKIKVPDNYNPVTREYTGEWSGNFKIAWTDNPVWIFYDLVTNSRYGLGQFIQAETIDKWALYPISKYCDEFVPNGFGGQEPRFSCNIFVQTRYEAYDLLMQLASVFRSMIFWSAGQVTCVQDSPSNPIALFTASNVIGGQFNYSGSSAKTRHTTCLVTWNDPKDRYKQKVEYVEDEEGIAKFGVIQAEILAFGCTSRGQAHRMGRWLLYSERMETETVTFKAGMDSALIYPGAIIQTQDQFRSGKRLGGRILAVPSLSEITVDSAVEIEAGKVYNLSVVLPDGSIESSTVTNPIGTYSSLTVSPAFTQQPMDYAIWVLSASDLLPESWRVVSIAEEEQGVISISALAYRKDKYDAIEKNLILEPIPTSTIDVTSPSAVLNLNVTEELYLVSASVVSNAVYVSWTGNSPLYVVSYSSNAINPINVETTTPSYSFKGIPPGKYTFSVTPVNAFGIKGATTSVVKEIYGLSAKPADVTGLAMSVLSGAAYITFNASQDLDVRVGGYLRLRHSSVGTSWNDAVDIGVVIPGTATSAVVPLLSGTYFAKWVDTAGNESVNATTIITDAPNILNLNSVLSISEHPDFNGTKSGVGKVITFGVPSLILDSSLTIDSMSELMDTWPVFSGWGGVRSYGEYFFDNSIDLGATYTSRLSAVLKTYGLSLNNYVDSWSSIDDLKSIDGTDIADVSARIFVKISQDDITYTEWEPLFVGDYTARYFKFKLVLTSEGMNNIAVTECTVNVDMPDTIQSGEDIVSGAGTYSVVFHKPYYTSPAVGITAQDMQTGDYHEITNKTSTGFDIIFKNQVGTPISRTFDYISKGY